MKKIIISIISFCFILQSCGLIWNCRETKSSIKKSSKYVNMIAVSVEELKQLIKSDTQKYKVLIIYSPCCSPCNAHFKTTYRKAYKPIRYEYCFPDGCK